MWATEPSVDLTWRFDSCGHRSDAYYSERGWGPVVSIQEKRGGGLHHSSEKALVESEIIKLTSDF